MAVTVLNRENFEAEVLQAGKTVLVDFWAVWCGPCRLLSPVVDKLEEDMGEKFKICKLNVDEEPELASKYRIMSIPTLMVFKNEKAVDSAVGVQSRTAIIRMLGQN